MRAQLDSIARWCEGLVVLIWALTQDVVDSVMSALFGTGEFRRAAERGQVDSIIAIVVVGVVAVVGLLVYSQVEGALPMDVSGARDDPANATTLENASASVGDGFGDSVDLIPIVMIVLVAALIIGVIQRFR